MCIIKNFIWRGLLIYLPIFYFLRSTVYLYITENTDFLNSCWLCAKRMKKSNENFPLAGKLVTLFTAPLRFGTQRALCFSQCGSILFRTSEKWPRLIIQLVVVFQLLYRFYLISISADGAWILIEWFFLRAGRHKFEGCVSSLFWLFLLCLGEEVLSLSLLCSRATSLFG